MSIDRTTDAYDQMLDQAALCAGDLAWQAEIGEHEDLDGAKEREVEND